MNASLIEVGIVVGLIIVVAAPILWFALRPGQPGAEPIIRTRLKKLQEDWYQVNLTIANRAPYGLVGVSLRRVRPRAARLIAPIKHVKTRRGVFQVWSDPAIDWLETSIPFDIAVGPHDSRQGIALVGPEAHATVWLFLPEKADPADVVLELALKDRGESLRRYRFDVVHGGRSADGR
jgi:hypothetical protein